MQVTCIVPLSRPSMLENMLANFVRQRHHAKRLVVVENGAAVGACKARGLLLTAVLTSEASAAAAKNAGLEWLRAHGGGAFAVFDDDDYYGPAYLSDAASALEAGHDVVGKSSIFVETSTGRLRAVLGWPEQAVTGCLVHGPTHCGHAETALEYPLMRVGEDGAWLLAMRAGGARVFSTSRFGFCYRRRADVAHTLVNGDDEIARCWARGGAAVHDFGVFDPAVIDGVLEVIPEQLDLGEYSVRDSAGARAAAEALGWNIEDMAAMPPVLLEGRA